MDYDNIQTLAGQLPGCYGYYYMMVVASPDASSIFVTVCVELECEGDFGARERNAPGAHGHLRAQGQRCHMRAAGRIRCSVDSHPGPAGRKM